MLDGDGGCPEVGPPLLRLALDSVTQAVAITDGSGAVVFWNQAAEKVFGYPAAEAVGRDLRSLIIPDEERPDTDQLIHGLRPAEPFVGELSVHDHAGRRFPIWASLTYLPGSEEGGNFVAVTVDLTEAHAAERENQMLASIVASSPDCILSVDLSRTIVWANPATERVLGWKPEELVGRPVDVIVPEPLREQSEVARRHLLSGLERLTPIQTRAVRRDGTLLDVAIMVNSYRDAGGRIVGTSAAIRDISEEVRTRRELEAMVARHTAQFEQVTVPQAFLDLEGRFVSINDAGCQLFGLSRKELLGRLAGELAHPRDAGRSEQNFRRLVRGEVDSATYEVVGRHAGGRALPLLVDVTVLRDAESRPYGVAMFARDLTDTREAQRRLAAQEALFRALNRRASDAAIVADADTNIIYGSPSLTEVFGYEPDELRAMVGYDLVHPDDLESARRFVASVVAQPDHSERMVLRLRDAAGQWRWVEETLTNCLTDPDIGGIVGNLRDVTAEMEAMRALEQSEARYRAIAETAQEGILLLGRGGEVLFANQKIADIVGHSMEEIYEAGLPAVLQEHDAQRLVDRLAARADRGPERYEFPFRHPSGRTLWLSVSATPLAAGDDLGSLAMVSDVTEARRAEEELRRQALHDALTGLPNRTLLADRLQVATARQERDENSQLAVLFLDLDHFKMVNDSHGHEVGDQLLRGVAHRLRQSVRHADTVARLGGDEFAVVCEDTDLPSAEAVATRIQESLKEPFDLDGNSVVVSASIGIALSPPYDPSVLLRNADAAMYRGKAAGRSRVEVFDNALAGQSRRRLDLTSALREAVRGRSVPLSYQPIVDLATSRVLGVEALLRWSPAGLRSVAPPEVVLAAEEAGLGLDLDALVLRTACTETAELRRAGVLEDDAYVAVNLSARSAEREALTDLVAEVLADAGLPSSALTLELTENAVMRDPERAVDLLERLTRSGVAIAVDDFGTGYSSLAYLHRLPVHVLKIDRSFVEKVTEDADSRAIVTSITRLGNALGLRVVAEGIETEAQAATMRDLGCHAGQGYLWGCAVPSGSLAASLAEHLG